MTGEEGRDEKLTWLEWGELKWHLWDSRFRWQEKGKTWETDLAGVRLADMVYMRQSLCKRWWQEKRVDMKTLQEWGELQWYLWDSLCGSCDESRRGLDMRNWPGGIVVSWAFDYREKREDMRNWPGGSEVSWNSIYETAASYDRRRGKIWETDLAGVRWAEMVFMRQLLWKRWWQKRVDLKN